MKKLTCGMGDVFDISRALVGVVVPSFHHSVVLSLLRCLVIVPSFHRFVVASLHRRQQKF